MRVPDMLLRSDDVKVRRLSALSPRLHMVLKSKMLLLPRIPLHQILMTVSLLQMLKMGRERRPMGKLPLRVTIRMQLTGCYRMGCLSFRMLPSAWMGVRILTRARMWRPGASIDGYVRPTR